MKNYVTLYINYIFLEDNRKTKDTRPKGKRHPGVPSTLTLSREQFWFAEAVPKFSNL